MATWTPIIWENDKAPKINAANLNHMNDGISEALDDANTATEEIAALQATAEEEIQALKAEVNAIKPVKGVITGADKLYNCKADNSFITYSCVPGEYMIMNFYIDAFEFPNEWGVKYLTKHGMNLPENMRPKQTAFSCTLEIENSDHHTYVLYVDTDGHICIYGRGGTSLAGQEQEVRGSICYPIGV